MEHELKFETPKSWTSTIMRERLIAIAQEVATILDPTRPPLGEPATSYESEEQSDFGETCDRTTREYAGLLTLFEVESGINDGATPSSTSFRGNVHALPEGFAVSCTGISRSPVHVQPSVVTVELTTPGDDVPPAIVERLTALVATP